MTETERLRRLQEVREQLATFDAIHEERRAFTPERLALASPETRAEVERWAAQARKEAVKFRQWELALVRAGETGILIAPDTGAEEKIDAC